MEHKSLQHLAFIMDGNRRWAKQNNHSISEGHKAGLKKMGELLEPLFAMHISVISVYAFSLDNWNREESEITFLHNMIKEFYNKELSKYKDKGIRVIISGVHDFLSSELLQYIKDIQLETKHFTKGTLNICFNYSGRREIIEGAKLFAQEIVDKKRDIQDLNIESFKDFLFQSPLPDVDLIVRTSGEYRISDFLIYQSAYAEYYFTNTLWPDLTLEEVKKAMNNFSERERRFGGS